MMRVLELFAGVKLTYDSRAMSKEEALELIQTMVGDHCTNGSALNMRLFGKTSETNPLHPKKVQAYLNAAARIRAHPCFDPRKDPLEEAVQRRLELKRARQKRARRIASARWRRRQGIKPRPDWTRKKGGGRL